MAFCNCIHLFVELLFGVDKTLRYIYLNLFPLLNHFTGNDTEVLLANISLSVNLTKQIKQENERIEQFLLNKTAILERKLQAARDKVARVRKIHQFICVIFEGRHSVVG